MPLAAAGGGIVKLYSFFRSSAAYRARIALNLKGLSFDTVPIHLTKDGGHQHSPEFHAINPQERVPALALPGEVLLQSLAIIEYLDEVYPGPALLPADALERAKVAQSPRSSPATSIPSTMSARSTTSATSSR